MSLQAQTRNSKLLQQHLARTNPPDIIIYHLKAMMDNFNDLLEGLEPALLAQAQKKFPTLVNECMDPVDYPVFVMTVVNWAVEQGVDHPAVHLILIGSGLLQQPAP